MNYEELVKALRDIEKTMFALGTSSIKMDNVSIRLAYDKKWGQTAEAAAAAIEELQAEIRESMQKCAECGDRMVEPKQGEWIDRYDEDDKPFLKRKYVCSACGGWNTYGKSKYCPKCGAKMEVQE